MTRTPGLILACNTLLFLTSPGFSVPPPEKPDDEFTFVVLGDSQFHKPNVFNRMIDQVVHLYPSFVLQVGDLIRGYTDDDDHFRAEWRRFKAQIEPLGDIPFMPVPGNHDVYDASGGVGGDDVFREVWGKTYYSFDYKNAHFVVLNTCETRTREIGGDQWTWLLRDLKKVQRKDHIFVFFHHPIYDLENQDALHAIFVEHNVSAVFYGHNHHLHYIERDGLPYIMTTAATNLGTPFEEAGSFHHLLQVRVRDDSYRVAVIRANSAMPPTVVGPMDNFGLYRLQKRFFTERKAAIDNLTKTDKGYDITLLVNNPSEQDLVAFFEWELPNDRWGVDGNRGRRVELPVGTKNHPVTFTLTRKYASPPEAYPKCVARTLFLTSDGDVVVSEHAFHILRKLEE